MTDLFGSVKDWKLNLFKFIVCFEEVHQAIAVAHSSVGHGGEKKTFKKDKRSGLI